MEIIDYKEIKNKIITRGYWEIVVRPVNFDERLISDKKTLKDLIANNSVQLRGWSYPFCSRDLRDVQAVDKGVASGVDWGRHKEVWRFDESGQLINYVGLWEDWAEEDDWSGGEIRKHQAGSIFSIIGTVYTLTEIMEFVRRLSSSEYYKAGVHIEIALHNIKGRELVILDPMRGPLFDKYVCAEEDIVLEPRDYTVEEIQSRSKEIAIDYVKRIFEMFNWNNMPLGVFQTDQEKLLEGRI